MLSSRTFAPLALFILITLPLASASCVGSSRGDAAELPEYGRVPEFELTDTNGAPFTRDDLNETIWIADFIFTRCPGVCPMMTRRFSRLQEDLSPEGIRLVSITVDPEHDTPDVLAEYARSAGAEDGRWVFLTGEKDAIGELAVKGFLLAVAVGDADVVDPIAEITHSQRFVLVDGTGRIRGYYDSTDAESLERLAVDARALAAEARQAT